MRTSLPKDAVTRIRTHLATLQLTTIAKTLDHELATADRQATSPVELLERILAVEAQARLERSIERRIKEARLPERKLLADFDFDFQSGVEQAQIRQLANLDFVSRGQSLVIAGNSGTGKSHIAKSLLLLGCTKAYRCRYTTAADMLKELLAGLADNTLAQRLKRYTAPQMLLIDELGFDRLEQHDARNASLFFKVIDGRYCKTSTLITTNIDFKELGDYLGDPVVTTAIVDRMIHHAIIINIEGPSFRMHESKKLNTKSKKSSQ
jgi:DNA replication protein DnaC